MSTDINIRAVALEALLEITENSLPAHNVQTMALEKYAYLSKADRAFFSKLIHGVLEYMYQIDYILGLYSHVKVKKLKPVIRGILRLSVYQILYMERVPDSAICDEAVKLSKKRGLAGLSGFVNGLLRNIAREKDTLIFPTPDVYYSMPKWMMDTIKESVGEEKLSEVLEAFLGSGRVTIRVNKSRTTVEKVVSDLNAQNIEVKISPLHKDVLLIRGFNHIEDVECLVNGEAFIQDVSSAMVCRVADIQAGNQILDVCAAPGGKSIHAADILRMLGSGDVLSCDVSEKKIVLIQENIKKSGFSNISTKCQDATIYVEAYAQKFDIVLADLPCSGLGIIGKKPDIKYRLKEKDIDALSYLQKNILENVSKYVKVGGKLVFSTCTLSKKENEDNVLYFLKNHIEFEPVEIFDKPYLKILPDANTQDGFFIAMCRRVR